MRVSSRYPIDDLDELFGVDVDEEDVDSVLGLMAKHLGKVPIPGSWVEAHGLRFEAEQATGRRNRIETVLISAVPALDRGVGRRLTDLSAEDAKLVTLARATRARTGAAEGAAVRDLDGRTYAAATVALPSLQHLRPRRLRGDGRVVGRPWPRGAVVVRAAAPARPTADAAALASSRATTSSCTWCEPASASTRRCRQCPPASQEADRPGTTPPYIGVTHHATRGAMPFSCSAEVATPTARRCGATTTAGRVTSRWSSRSSTHDPGFAVARATAALWATLHGGAASTGRPRWRAAAAGRAEHDWERSFVAAVGEPRVEHGRWPAKPRWLDHHDATPVT